MASSLTATWIETKVKPKYWFRNLVLPFLFADPLATTVRPQAGSGVNTVVEGRPYSALQAHIRKILKSIDMDRKFAYASLLSRSTSAFESLLGTMGHPLVLARVNSDYDGAGTDELLNSL